MTGYGEPELTDYHRHLAALLKRSDDEKFRALLEQRAGTCAAFTSA
ncbi:hypothetical protein [Streptomyces sp. NPDC004008]